MSVELILWLFSFASVMVLIGLTAYQLICLSDLEYDYINPYDSSSRINAVVVIEYSLQAALCTSFLLTLHWFPFLVMAPVTYYHVKLYMARKHLVDVTEIFRQLNGEKKYRMIKLAFYFCLFIITIYRFDFKLSFLVNILWNWSIECIHFASANFASQLFKNT
ncbi:Protein cornichon-like protein 1 [Dichanthelium oligosanthes]|uniref:Protein cornichon-like protein 1 n=1 Tax=Dichanthelium oligosanthes TaxID=888268 RepID=A0A1E5WFT5_9POAL|nr:Protein cornichon-like protein 1 [Dichanthelium oligosanthes]